ncbi:MAG: hypothetical protein ICV59_03105 [Thermoleophilia bacterium]|nr:hypothetical protein [Thermoleophilia bacterium]
MDESGVTGEGKVIQVAVADAIAMAGSVSIKISMTFWLVWARIAFDHERRARDARRAAEAAQANGERGAEFGEALGREMQDALVAVSGCAHAVDAVYGAVKPGIPIPEATSDAWKRNRTPRQRQILETLKAGFAIDGKTVERWLREFDWLDDLRDAVVHPEERLDVPHPHPTGTNVAAASATYTIEAAERARRIVLEVFDRCTVSPRSANDEIVAWASRNRPAVETLLHEYDDGQSP